MLPHSPSFDTVGLRLVASSRSLNARQNAFTVQGRSGTLENIEKIVDIFDDRVCYICNAHKYAANAARLLVSLSAMK